MKKSKVVFLTAGAMLLGVVVVVVGLMIWGFGISQMFRYSPLPEGELDENIVVVEDSVEWKLLSPPDRDARISFRFTLRNPTDEDISVNVFHLEIGFFDSDGFALGRFNVTERVTVPANGEFVYAETYTVRDTSGDQMGYAEVLGVRSKQ